MVHNTTCDETSSIHLFNEHEIADPAKLNVEPYIGTHIRRLKL